MEGIERATATVPPEVGSRSGHARRLLLALVAAGLVCLAGFLLYQWLWQPTVNEERLAPGEHVVMANGLTLAAPAAGADEIVLDRTVWRASWLHRDHRYYDEQVMIWPAQANEGPVASFLSFAGDPLDSIAAQAAVGDQGLPPLASASPDGRTRIYWRQGSFTVLVTTALPGHARGLVTVLGVLPDASPSSGALGAAVQETTAEDVNRALAAAWRELSVEGLPAPQIRTTE